MARASIPEATVINENVIFNTRAVVGYDCQMSVDTYISAAVAGLPC